MTTARAARRKFIAEILKLIGKSGKDGYIHFTGKGKKYRLICKACSWSLEVKRPSGWYRVKGMYYTNETSLKTARTCYHQLLGAK